MARSSAARLTRRSTSAEVRIDSASSSASAERRTSVDAGHACVVAVPDDPLTFARLGTAAWPTRMRACADWIAAIAVSTSSRIARSTLSRSAAARVLDAAASRRRARSENPANRFHRTCRPDDPGRCLVVEAAAVQRYRPPERRPAGRNYLARIVRGRFGHALLEPGALDLGAGNQRARLDRPGVNRRGPLLGGLLENIGSRSSGADIRSFRCSRAIRSSAAGRRSRARACARVVPGEPARRPRSRRRRRGVVRSD